MPNDRECIIWTESAVWLQTYDSEGRLRLSDCGRISQSSVEAFARAHNLCLDIRRPKVQQRGTSAAPVGTSAARSRQNRPVRPED